MVDIRLLCKHEHGVFFYNASEFIISAYNLTLWFAMNDLPVIAYPCYAQRTLGSPGGKYCESLEENVWQKLVSTSMKTILGRDQRFFTFVLSRVNLGNVDIWKM